MGRSIERHRAQSREQLGFRECAVADAEKLTGWLAEHVAERERRHEFVRDELLAPCRGERIEPPAPGRIDRIVRSALRVSEETLTTRVVARLSDDSRQRIAVLLSHAVRGASRPPALANRAGDAPIKAPRTLQSDHLAFTLPGSLWLPLVGGLASTPSVGSYLADGPRATRHGDQRLPRCRAQLRGRKLHIAHKGHS